MAGNDRTLPDAKVALNNEAPINSDSFHFYEDLGEEYYDMSGEKILVIFSHSSFFGTKHFKAGKPRDRKSAEIDVERLTTVFEQLGFKIKKYDNLFHTDILKKVSKVCNQKHTETSCLCIALLTHGDYDNVYAADRPYKLSDITKLLESGHKTLVGKPKLVFVEAARGNQVDGGQVELDGIAKSRFVIPTHADFLLLYSCVEDYFPYENDQGSWFIKNLCDVIRNHSEELDLMHMVIRLHRIVAYKVTTIPGRKEIDKKKQMTEVRSTLRKLLKLE